MSKRVSVRAIIRETTGDGDLRGESYSVEVPNTPVSLRETDHQTRTTISRTILGYVQAETGTQDRLEPDSFTELYNYLGEKYGEENITLTGAGVDLLDREGTSPSHTDGGLTAKQESQVMELIRGEAA